MSKFYSKSTGGFYTRDIHEPHQIPVDAVEISDEAWRELLDAQSRGQRIMAGTNGIPIAVDRDPAPGLLASRDAALRETDWLVARHRDEVEIDPRHTTLTAEEYSALQQWRRSLRNITHHPEFPRVRLPERPV
jgi:hypothetical protein